MRRDLDRESERIIRDRLIQGDQQALAELFEEHRRRLWQIVHFRTDIRIAGRLDPDDILQDAFVDASNRLPHFTRDKQFSPFVWLRMIVAQTLIDIHRRHLGSRQRDASREVANCATTFPQSTSMSLVGFLSAQITTPSEVVIRREQRLALIKAIESMEPIDREVLALRHFEELTNTEIAEVLNISQKAASIRYVRAVVRLKQILTHTSGFSDSVYFKRSKG